MQNLEIRYPSCIVFLLNGPSDSFIARKEANAPTKELYFERHLIYMPVAWSVHFSVVQLALGEDQTQRFGEDSNSWRILEVEVGPARSDVRLHKNL